MKSKSLFSVLAASVFICMDYSTADKGDVFLSVMPIVSPSFSPEGVESMFGLGSSLSIGANEKTDFQLEVDWTAQPSFDSEGITEIRYVLGSFFTPYFGDIRPRFGGSAGLAHVIGAGATNEANLNIGLHLQGLYELSSDTRIFAEVNPSSSLGSNGGISTLFKVGAQFRLSK